VANVYEGFYGAKCVAFCAIKTLGGVERGRRSRPSETEPRGPLGKHITRILREFHNAGGKLRWIAQTASEVAYEGNIRQIAAAGADAIYLHGTKFDELFKKGDYEEIRRRLGLIRETGLPVGIGTHMPHAIEYVEEHNWDVDFYMACVYNLSRIDRVSSAITGVSNQDEPFFDEYIPVMYKTIRQTSKPCLAFKILGATRRCVTQEAVQAAFDEAYANIKSTDCVVVGMYPKDIDQIMLNCTYAAEAIAKVSK
jgi:hypothetical protein